MCKFELFLDLMLIQRLASNSPLRPDLVQLYTMAASWEVGSGVSRISTSPAVPCPGLLLEAACEGVRN